MCGIVGYLGDRPAYPMLIQGLRRLEYRGYDSAGVALVHENGTLDVFKSKGKVADLERATQGQDVSGTIGIAHTRWATHGEPNDANAHPHYSQSKTLAIIHNGIIENYNVLREMLRNHDYTFQSDTDTEVLVQLIEYIKQTNHCDLCTAVQLALHEVVGAYAIAVIEKENPDLIVAARKSSPLVIGIRGNERFLASDATPIIEHTKEVVYLNDEEVAVIRRNEPLQVVSLDNVVKPLHIKMLEMNISQLEKGGFPHFMLKEIMEQPRAIKSTLDPRVKDHRVVFDELKMTDEQLMGFNKIMITACGSAFYAGQAGKYALEKLTHIPVDADLASEFRYRDPIIDEHTLMIIISQSGETADTIAAIREAQSKGAYVLSIVNVVGSTIARISDDVIYTWAGPEIAVATTKGYTTQVSVLYLLALYLGEKRGCLSREEAAKLTDDLMILPQMVQRAIDLNPQIAQLAERYKNNPSLFFIGRNVDYAVCMEGSLKLKEISYLHSEAYAAGELKHGTIALIEENRLVIAVACYEPLFDKTMSNVKEVKARGARVLGVALEGNRAIYSEADDVILVPRMDDLFVVPAEIVPLQLFAYYVAKANGCAIDKPKNLAKSVTVE